VPPRTPLLRPDRYFAERDLHLGRVFLVFGLVLASALGLTYGVGYVLTTHVDGTVLVDNPDRPPEVFCEAEWDSAVFDEEDCDAPRQVERNVDPIVRQAVGELAGLLFVGMLFVVAGLTLVVHVGSWLAGGTDGVTASFAVTVWGMAPIVVTVPLSLAALSVALDPVTVAAAGDPAAAFADLEAQIRAHAWVGTVSSLVNAVWSGAIWKFGLEHERGLDGRAATAVAGAAALLLVLGGAV
jgi:hypothetical protein